MEINWGKLHQDFYDICHAIGHCCEHKLNELHNYQKGIFKEFLKVNAIINKSKFKK